MTAELRYWDSVAFLAYFQEEEGRVDACEAVLEDAENGKVLIVTSALTLAEVLALRGAKRIAPDPKLKQQVIGFFKNEYIAVQNVTREVAELARDLVWDRGIKPKDAVHVASAIAAEVAIFETYDKALARKVSKIKGMTGREPPVRPQAKLPLLGGGSRAASEKGDGAEAPIQASPKPEDTGRIG